MVTTNHYSEITRCQESDYKENIHGASSKYDSETQKMSFHKKYYEANKDRVQYCVKDADVYFQGTRDSPIKQEDSSYVVYEVHRCSEATMLPGYPECASRKEIDEWTKWKKATFKLISSKIDLNERNDRAVNYEEIFLNQAPLAAGLYTDSGFRLRYNAFNRQDYWWKGYKNVDVFFDYIFYNHDTYEVPKTNTLIAEMYWRLGNDQVTHWRKAFSLMDLFGALGGVSKILLQVCGFVVMSYSQFWASFSTTSMLYKV